MTRHISFWKRVICPIVFVGLASIGVPYARAATVQGAAVCQNGPAFNAAISVFRADIGQSSLSPVDGNGMFYLYNIPPGNYVLQVWSRTNPAASPLLYQISVFEPITSLPVLRLPC